MTAWSFIVPGMILVVVLAVFALLAVLAKNYIKVPPNKVAVFYGKKQQAGPDGKPVGFKVITGGAKFKMPLFESVTYLDLNMFSLDLKVHGAPNKDGVMVNVKGVANVKILSDEVSLMSACERFLGMEQQAIEDIAYKNLEGHLRSIIGRLTVEEIVSDRTKLNQEILSEAASDLKKLGLGIDLLTIQEIDDENGYITSLGKKRTAEVMRDAEIGKAEAERDSKIKTTDAGRDAAQKANANQILVNQAEKEKDVKIAEFSAEVATQKAKAEQAGPLATADARKAVVIAEVEVRKTQTMKEAEVAVAEAEKREKELMAEVIKPAEAQKIAAIATAEGIAEAMERTAAADMVKKTKEGEGIASAIRAKMIAEADGIRAKLLAEAEGIMKKAEAYAKLDESGRLLQILEAIERILPASIEKLGPVMAEIAKPFASVDRISLVDLGGDGSNGGSIGKFMGAVPKAVLPLFEGLKAIGLDPVKLQDFLKLNPIDGESGGKGGKGLLGIFNSLGVTEADVAEFMQDPTPENFSRIIAAKKAEIAKKAAAEKAEVVEKAEVAEKA